MSVIDPKNALSNALQQSNSGQAGGIADRLRAAVANGDEDSVRAAARQFESFFVSMMVREMRQAGAGDGGLFSGSEMETFSGMFDQEISNRIASGQGIGLASYLTRALQGPGAGGTERGTSVVGVERSRRSYTPAKVFSRDNSNFSWPLPESDPGRISSNYGARKDPIHGGHREHHGLDIAAARGTPVLAMADGTVVRAGRAGNYGKVVYLDHGDGVVTRYAHQDTLTVKVGDQVARGEQLGSVGATGRVTGAHLHLEVRVDGESVDPHRFLESGGRD